MPLLPLLGDFCEGELKWHLQNTGVLPDMHEILSIRWSSSPALSSLTPQTALTKILQTTSGACFITLGNIWLCRLCILSCYSLLLFFHNATNYLWSSSCLYNLWASFPHQLLQGRSPLTLYCLSWRFFFLEFFLN